jgi:hypothetical protein
MNDSVLEELVLRLPHRETFRLRPHLGTRLVVTCTRGVVWLTLDRDSRDLILETGETSEIGAQRPALVMALRNAELKVVTHSVRPGTGFWRHAQAVSHRLASWWRLR